SPALLARCCELLMPGGRIVVQAQFLDNERTSPRWATLLNLMQCVASAEGQNHTIAETREWLERAGFRNVRQVRFSVWNGSGCLVGRGSGDKMRITTPNRKD